MKIEWPQSEDDTEMDKEITEWMRNDFINHPEKYCGQGGPLHRMIFIGEVEGKGYFESLRICMDCGTEGRFGIERLPKNQAMGENHSI